MTLNLASQIRTETQSNDAYSWDGHVDLSRSYTTNGLNQYESAGSASFCYDDALDALSLRCLRALASDFQAP